MQIWLEQMTLGKNWTFDNLRGIKKSTDRNQIPLEEKQKPNPKKKEKKETLYQKSQNDWEPKACVYWWSKSDHKSSDCKTRTTAKYRKNYSK